MPPNLRTTRPVFNRIIQEGDETLMLYRSTKAGFLHARERFLSQTPAQRRSRYDESMHALQTHRQLVASSCEKINTTISNVNERLRQCKSICHEILSKCEADKLFINKDRVGTLEGLVRDKLGTVDPEETSTDVTTTILREPYTREHESRPRGGRKRKTRRHMK
jgi:hypothetical protein